MRKHISLGHILRRILGKAGGHFLENLLRNNLLSTQLSKCSHFGPVESLHPYDFLLGLVDQSGLLSDPQGCFYYLQKGNWR